MARHSNSIPATQRAVVAEAAGKSKIKENVAVPEPEENEVLVKIMAVAINPVDGKTLTYSCTPGAVSGCDFAGVVVGPPGPKAKRRWEEGSRVCGWIMGANPVRLSNGSFAQYLVAKADLLIRIPDSMPFETAATYGMSVGTGGLALFKDLGLSFARRLVTPSSPSVLVYGGSTSSGAMAIQLLRIAGYRAVAVCSRANFDMVKKLGAVEAFDYHDKGCGEQIRAYTLNKLYHAMDCISTSSSMEICYSALSSNIGGKSSGGGSSSKVVEGYYLSLDPFPARVAARRPEIQAEWILAFTMLGDLIALGGIFRREAGSDDYAFGTQWHQTAERLLEEGAVKPHPYKLVEGGLDGIQGAMEASQKGHVSAVKQVCIIG